MQHQDQPVRPRIAPQLDRQQRQAQHDQQPPLPGTQVEHQHADQEDQAEGGPEQHVRQHAEVDQRRDREDRERFERQEQPKAMLDQVAQP